MLVIIALLKEFILKKLLLLVYSALRIHTNNIFIINSVLHLLLYLYKNKAPVTLLTNSDTNANPFTFKRFLFYITVIALLFSLCATAEARNMPLTVGYSGRSPQGESATHSAPVITENGALLALNSTYGTASASTNFTVSGTNMTAGILITPPAGFEVSTDDVTFTGAVTIGTSGTIAPTTVYIRLASSAPVGNYSGNIVLSSKGSTNVNAAIAPSSVTPAPLTITANNVTKTYGAVLTGGPGSAAFTAPGLQNSETIGSVTIGYGPGSTATDGVGTYTGCVTAANATGGTFSARNYIITYAGAQIIVNPAPLSIIANNVIKAYGATLTGGPGSTAFTATGLQNGETIGTVTIAYSSGSAATDGVGTYTDCVTVAAGTGGTFLGYNYTITHVPAAIIVNAAPLAITANNVNKTYGTTLSSASGSTAFTATGLQNSETIGSVTINYGAGSTVNAPIGTYYGSVTATAATGGTFSPNNYNITYLPGNIIIAHGASGVITENGVPLALNTTYGIASASTSFTVSGTNMTAGILVTPPAGFEVSADNITFTGVITVGASGTIVATTVYIRLASSTAAGNYSSNIVLSSTGAANVNVAMANCAVNPARLTITVNNVTKTYGTFLTGGPSSRAFTATGLQNLETIGSVTIGYGPGSAATDGVGTYTGCVTAANATGGTFQASNYTITYVSAQIIVNPAPLSIIANNVIKTYGATLTGGSGSTAFTATGLQNGETIGTVTIAYGSGSAATDSVGRYFNCVTIAAGTGGNFSGHNYTITHVPGDIIVIPAPLTITADNVDKAYGATLSGTSGSLVFTVTGLQNSQTIGSVTINYGTGSAANAPVGTYYLCVSIANATGGTFLLNEYAITYVPGNIIVGTNFSTISVAGSPSALSTSYGKPSSSTSFTESGTNMGAYVLLTPPTGFELSTDDNAFNSTVTIRDTGAYTLKLYIRLAPTAPVGDYSGNIALSSTDAPIVYETMPICTVTAAGLTITADNKGKNYEEVNPDLTVTYSGFVNNDGPAQLTAQPIVTTTALTASPVGEYPIAASGAEATNYTFNYVPGVLTIYPNIQMIMVPNAFTPNGDGINDTWDIKNLYVFQNCTVQIFNRYGQNIYFSNGYGIPWDGTYRGAALPVGTYYYIINLKNGDKILSGSVTIIK